VRYERNVNVVTESIAQVNAAIIQSLVDNRVPEGRTLEYKSQLPGPRDEDKREFLYDASSFANTNGGDMIFGVTDKRKGSQSTGVPEAVAGIDSSTVSASILRLESLIRDGISPRVHGIEFRAVEVSSGQSVLVLRMPRSWIGPHMVTFNGGSRFYSRNAGGKQMMDVAELRRAFALASTLPEKLRAYRIERINHIESGQGPLPLPAGAKVILHVIPLAALDSMSDQDFATSALTKQMTLKLPPMGGSSWGHRFNFDGFVTYSPTLSYVQLFRSGVVEAVKGDESQARLASGDRLLPGIVFEQEIIGAVRTYLDAQRHLGVPLPIFLALSLNGVKGYTLASNEYRRIERFDRDLLLTTPLSIEDFGLDVPTLLRTTFDSIWQAAGAEGSPNYDSTGQWSGRIKAG